MKRLHFIVEGYTEIEFLRVVLIPYIKTKTGIDGDEINFSSTDGIVNFNETIFEMLSLHLKNKEKIVTTCYDYYGIQSTHRFKNYREAKEQNNPKDGVKILKDGMRDVLIERKVNVNNFVPYLQKYEFEALLFSSLEGFRSLCTSDKMVIKFKRIIQQFPNPEDINDSPDKAPSKRIKSIVKDYDKYVNGPEIAQIIGIEMITEKCPHFKSWVSQLVRKIKE